MAYCIFIFGESKFPLLNDIFVNRGYLKKLARPYFNGSFIYRPKQPRKIRIFFLDRKISFIEDIF